MCDRTVTDQVVALADEYADQFVTALSSTTSGQVLATTDSLRKAVAGILISYLSEVLMTVNLDERRHTELVPKKASSVKTTAAL